MDHAPCPACSTPFGIRDGNTNPHRTWFSARVGAQRLSASEMETRAILPSRSSFSKCSTPFGIRDGNTPVPAARHADGGVLNAFRHQRWKHTSRRRILAEKGLECSTPFGIRDGNTRLSPGLRVPICQCSTPFGIRDGNTVGICPSNATGKRAQRLSASEMETRAAHIRALSSAAQCSTPFGIRDGNTETHKRGTRVGKACSTPFGIRDGNTRRKTCRSAKRMRAQRLSASEMETHDAAFLDDEVWPLCSTPFGIRDGNTRRGRNALREGRVLNAFRHQRWKHPKCWSPMRPAWCAQRLSASEMETRSSKASLAWASRLCSTPFGIRDGNTQHRRMTRAAIVLCSTPFGIRDGNTRGRR